MEGKASRETYNKDSSLSGIHLPEQILLFLLRQWQEGLKVSRRGLYRWSGVRRGCVGVWFDPPPLTPIVLREHKGSCQTLVVSGFGQTRQAAAAEGLNLAGAPPMTNQETKREATVCLLKWLFPKCRKSRKELTCSFSDLLFRDVVLGGMELNTFRSTIQRQCKYFFFLFLHLYM